LLHRRPGRACACLSGSTQTIAGEHDETEPDTHGGIEFLDAGAEAYAFTFG
jgi:hypothetical protein